MATFTDQYQEWLSQLTKRLLNQSHTSSTFLPGEDPAVVTRRSSALPSHYITAPELMIGQELEVPPPTLDDGVSNGLVRRFGDDQIPPIDSLGFSQVPSVPDNRAWILVDGDSADDQPWATKPPGIGFLDGWVDGPNQTPNANGQTYSARLWHGTSAPTTELQENHPSGPLFDPSTGVLFFASGNPYDFGIPSNDQFFFTGWLYEGETVAERVARINTKWAYTRICVTPRSGLDQLNQSLRFRLAPRSVNDRLIVLHNNLALMRPFDYTVAANGAALVLTQSRAVVRAGDYLQVFYRTYS